MADVDVIGLDDREAWSSALVDLPHGFQHRWEYSDAMYRTSGYPTFLFHAREGDNRLACPFVEREFGDYRDIATPSGLAGLLGAGDWSQLEGHWNDFVAERGYVCGYIGLHPVFEPPGVGDEAPQHNSLYLLDLELGVDELLRRVDQNRRRQLRGWDERAKDFLLDRNRIADFLVRNYEDFMQQAGADEPQLSNESLELLAHADGVVTVGVAETSRLTAVALFGVTEHAGDFMINIALPEGRRHATDLLWYGVVALATQGVPVLNLGGGGSEDDDVARAKQRYRARRVPLRSLRQVYREDVYTELCRQAGVAPSVQGYFPAYRSTT